MAEIEELREPIIDWKEAGKGNDKVSLFSDMLVNNCVLLKYTTRKGNSEKEWLKIKYDRKYVVIRLLYFCRYLLPAITHEEWQELMEEIWKAYHEQTDT